MPAQLDIRPSSRSASTAEIHYRVCEIGRCTVDAMWGGHPRSSVSCPKNPPHSPQGIAVEILFVNTLPVLCRDALNGDAFI